MKIIANKFTPEVLIQAPRRTPGSPNSTGTLAVYTASTYSFDTHSKSSEIRVLDIKTGHSTSVTKDAKASEPVWLEETSLVWLQGGDKGVTHLVLGDVELPKKSYGYLWTTQLSAITDNM